MSDLASSAITLTETGQDVFVSIRPPNANPLEGSELCDHILLELTTAGYGGYFIDQKVLGEISRQRFTPSEGTKTFKIAEKKDAVITVTLASDEMQAWLEVHPAYGGVGASREGILKALQTAGVQYGIRENVIEQALMQGQLEKALVAEGRAVKPGKDAWFEYLVSDVKKMSSPTVREDGTVDYFELNFVTTVQIGDPLMRKHPAHPGAVGITVSGLELPAQPGQDKPLLQHKGSRVSEFDPCLLVAEKGGSPIPGPNFVRVEEVITVRRVGVETGNIEFNGTVLITDGIDSGFRVKALGDIEVQGTVEAATLEADGNIYLHAGVVGGHHQARLTARGDIKARFIENAVVECGRDLLIKDGLLHCHSEVAGQALVGIEQGKGQINGGKVFATSLVKANILGSVSSTRTQISVGPAAYLRDKLAKVTAEMHKNKQILEETIKTLIYIRTRAPEKSAHLPLLEEEREVLMSKINVLTEEVKNLQKLQTVSVNQCRIVALNKIYAGVRLCFIDSLLNITHDTPASVFILHKDNSGDAITPGVLSHSDMQWDKAKT